MKHIVKWPIIFAALILQLCQGITLWAHPQSASPLMNHAVSQVGKDYAMGTGKINYFEHKFTQGFSTLGTRCHYGD